MFNPNMGIENRLEGWAVGAIGHHSWSDEDFSRWAVSLNNVCSIIHSGRQCACDARHWTPLSSVEDLGNF
jgi:hypothetical protein